MNGEDIKTQTLKLWKDGLTSNQISTALGITRSRVMGMVNRAQRMGLVPRRPQKIGQKKVTIRGTTPVPAPASNPSPKKKVTLAVVSIQKEPEMPKKPIEPPKQAELPLHRAKRITELGSFDCRWIQPDKRYCARPAKSARTPWCDEHYSLVYVPNTKRIVRPA